MAPVTYFPWAILYIIGRNETLNKLRNLLFFFLPVYRVNGLAGKLTVLGKLLSFRFEIKPRKFLLLVSIRLHLKNKKGYTITSGQNAIVVCLELTLQWDFEKCQLCFHFLFSFLTFFDFLFLINVFVNNRN